MIISMFHHNDRHSSFWYKIKHDTRTKTFIINHATLLYISSKHLIFFKYLYLMIPIIVQAFMIIIQEFMIRYISYIYNANANWSSICHILVSFLPLCHQQKEEQFNNASLVKIQISLTLIYPINIASLHSNIQKFLTVRNELTLRGGVN